MKILTAAAVAILLSSGIAYAQDNGNGGPAGAGADNPATNDPGTTGSVNEGGGSDASNYLAGPNIHRFYQDEQMNELRSEAEVKERWEAMSDADRTSLRSACMNNADARFNDLCKSVGMM